MLSQLESSLIKEYKDLMCENYEQNDLFFDIGDEGRSISFNSVSKEVQVKMNYEVTVNEVTSMFTHDLSVTNETYISEIIYMAVRAFNEHYHEIKHEDGSIDRVSLITSDSSKYELKPSKKNGKAKDVPAFCLDTTLHLTQTDNFILLFKTDCLISIKVKEKNELEQPKNQLMSSTSDQKDSSNNEHENNNQLIKKKNSCSIM